MVVAGVIGVPDETAGEIVKAYVTLNPGYTADEAMERELRGHARLAPRTSPRAVGPGARPCRGALIRRLDRVRVYHEKQARYLDARVQKSSELDKKSKSLDAGNGFAAAPPGIGCIMGVSTSRKSRLRKKSRIS